VVSTYDVIGWWRGENDLTAAVGPDATGTVGYTTGRVGRAIDLGGGSLVTADALATVSTAVTAEAWVKPVRNSQTQAVLSRWTWVGGDTDDSFALLIGANGDLLWMTDDTSTRSAVPLSANVPAIYDGQFHHVAATWSSSEIAVYFDGVRVALAPSQGGVLNPGDSTSFRIGSEGGPGSPMFLNGAIDEPTVYRRALTSDEIQGIYSAGPAAKCVWAQKARFTGAGNTNDALGWDVDVSGDTMVAGTFRFGGPVYVYTRNGASWAQQAVLTQPDGATDDFFGQSVAISGDTIVVGSYFHDPVLGGATLYDAGAAYVYRRSGTTWNLEQKLLASDAATTDLFGWSVDVQGDTVLVGADGRDTPTLNAGAAYVFTRTGATWTQQAELVAGNGVADDRFGYAVALDGSTAVVGAPQHIATGGAAYVFVRAFGVWSQQAFLQASGTSPDDLFGSAVSVAGDLAVVGSWAHDGPAADSGAAYLYARTGTAWGAPMSLGGTTNAAGDFFGSAVAVSGTTVIVGAPGADVGTSFDQGTVYSYAPVAGVWSFEAEVRTTDATAGDFFGAAVGLDQKVAAVGAPLDDAPQIDSGSVYVFSR
jgi:hypothetical protein